MGECGLRVGRSSVGRAASKRACVRSTRRAVRGPEIAALGACAAELTVLRGFGIASTRRWEELRAATALEPTGLSEALDSLVARSLVRVRPCIESAEFVLTQPGSTSLRRAIGASKSSSRNGATREHGRRPGSSPWRTRLASPCATKASSVGASRVRNADVGRRHSDGSTPTSRGRAKAAHDSGAGGVAKEPSRRLHCPRRGGRKLSSDGLLERFGLSGRGRGSNHTHKELEIMDIVHRVGITASADNVYPGDAEEIALALRLDPKGVERRFASFALPLMTLANAIVARGRTWMR